MKTGSLKNNTIADEERHDVKQAHRNTAGYTPASAADDALAERVKNAKNRCAPRASAPSVFGQLQPEDITSASLLNRLKEEMDMGLKGGIYHLTQIKLCYNSNCIEESKLYRA